MEYLGVEDYDEHRMRCCCPFHAEDTPSFIFNPKEYSMHCFRGDTKVITRFGTKAMQDIVEDEVEVINGNGQWEKVRFHYLGEQEIVKLNLIRSTKKKTIYTTANHEWLVHRRKEKVTTLDLRNGFFLESQWYCMNPSLEPDVDGMAHGFIYGDGYKSRINSNGDQVFAARVCTPSKRLFCEKVFDEIQPPSKKDKPSYAFGYVSKKARKNLKEVPSIMEPDSYLYGFLIGYFVADGNCSDNTAIFSSTKYDELSQIRDICTKIGIPTYSIGSTTRTPESNMGCVPLTNNSTIYTLRMAKGMVPEQFYYGDKRMIPDPMHMFKSRYRVESVESTLEIAPVYCCETSTHSFVLEDFVLTGNCFGCNINCDILDAYMIGKNATFTEAAQNLFELSGITYSFGEHKVKTKRQYRYPKPVECTDKSKVYEYLDDRKISPKTADYLDIRQDDKGNIVFNYYDTQDVLMMCKYRPARKIQHGENKNWCQKDADTTPLLFNMNRINPSQPLIISTGELDCASLVECGLQNAVSVPFGDGTLTWIEECFDWLEQFQEIIVCHDNDDPGYKFVKEVVPRLGSWRCKVANCPEYYIDEEKKTKRRIKDINEVLYWFGPKGVVEMVANAADTPVPSLVDLSDVEEKDLSIMDGIYTGIIELDRQLMKLFYGTFNIVSGTPGSGKTSWLYQLVCNTLDQGLGAWVFSRELPDYMTKNWMNFLFAGPRNVKPYTNEKGGTYYRVPPPVKSAVNNTYRGLCHLYRDDYENDVEDLQVSMTDAARKYGCKLFLIDNLMTVNLHADDSNKYDKQTEFVNWLIHFSAKFNVCTILVCHPRKLQYGQEDMEMYDVAGSSNLVNLAHRGFGLKRISKKEKEGKRNRRGDGWDVPPCNYDVKLTILKDRMRGRSNFELGMYYDEKSRRFFSSPEEYDKQYRWDTNTYTDTLPYTVQDNTEEVFGAIEEGR